MDNHQIFKHGLTTKQAEKLLQEYGPNEIKQTRRFTLLQSFLNQFNNFLILLLILAGSVSWFLGERLDSLFIFIVVVMNAFFGVYQEFKAEKALTSLKKLTVTKIRVIRDGKEQEIDSRNLVPGDIIYLDEGTKIPADAQVLKSWYLEVNEASLTGESLPILKHESDVKHNQIFMGTTVVKGRSYAKVLKTGQQTQFGQIAKSLTEIKEEPTPLQKKLESFTKQVGIIGILASLTVLILSFIQNKTFFESFIFAVSLAVAAVPEGLPAVMTITLAIGVERMAKKRAIVRKLNAIETLGSITLVATDKTGTLTTNQMAVKEIWIDGKMYNADRPPFLTNYPFSLLVSNGILCSTASLVMKVDGGAADVIGDPTEGALLLLAKKVGLDPDFIKNEWKVLDEEAFSAETKRMMVAVENEKNKGNRYIFSKGAPESILSICDKILMGKKEIPLDDVKKTSIEKEFQKLAKKGFRLLAFAYKKQILNPKSQIPNKFKIQNSKSQTSLEFKKLEFRDYLELGASNFEFPNMIFLGFVAIHDPPRPEVVEAVGKARAAGIKTIMITGDNELTAEAVAIETGIIKEGEDIIKGAQIDQFSDEQLLKILPKTKVFARTSPQHKYRLVKLFQQLGEIIAVTGDGVNDALALKQADVGVAMGITGTDVARETADMIITDDNFVTIISAIDQGRNIFNQIKNAIKFLLACNLGEVIYILLAVLANLPILSALQILYVNLVTDGLPAISLAFAPGDGGIMKQPPRKSMTILEKVDFKYISILGILTATLSFLAGIPLLMVNNQPAARTIIFTTLTLIQPVILIDLWLSRKPVLKHLHLLKKPIFLLAFLFPFLLHPFIIYHPFLQTLFKTTSLNPFLFLLSLLFPFLILVPIEMRKLRK
jgi:Ca2+-transporting ATPase